VPGKSPVKVQLEVLVFFLGELHVVYMEHVFLMVNVTWTDFDSLAFIVHFFKQNLDCK
jgi:hypothetical protein